MKELLQLLNDIDFMEDFIKAESVNNKIDSQTAREILRLITEMKTKALATQ